MWDKDLPHWADCQLPFFHFCPICPPTRWVVSYLNYASLEMPSSAYLNRFLTSCLGSLKLSWVNKDGSLQDLTLAPSFIWLTWHNPTCFVHIKQSLLWILKDPILKIPISEHFLVWWFVNILSKNILKSMTIPRHPLYTSSNFNLQLALYLKCDTG